VWIVMRLIPSTRVASIPVMRFNSAARSNECGALPPPIFLALFFFFSTPLAGGGAGARSMAGSGREGSTARYAFSLVSHSANCGLYTAIAQPCQHAWIPLAPENRTDDRLSRHAADIADGVGQLHVHRRERLLHVLNAARG